jgi:RHS repeat-associated protein
MGSLKEKYIYDGQDIALVVDAAGVITERYLYGAGVDNMLSKEANGQVIWSLGDRQGSVVDLVNEQGAVVNHFVYDSFGNRTSSTAADFRFGYTGRELDAETGLYYYRARYYDPAVGRFISEDPIGFSAGDTNLYRYVGNNATNYTDPTGTTISGWADDLLNGTDQFFAGFGDTVTFGASTEFRKWKYGNLATQNHEGGAFLAGNIIGGVASLALGYGAERLAAGALLRGVRAYDTIGIGVGIAQGTHHLKEGTATGWDLLNFLPAAGFAAKNGRKIGGAVLKAGDAWADDTWRVIDRLGETGQPKLILAADRISDTGMNASQQGDSFFQHFMAMVGGKSSPLSQPGGLTLTEGLTVVRPSGKSSKPTHPLTKHGPDVTIQDLKSRVQNEIIPKNFSGIVTKFNDRETMERAINITIARNQQQINSWLASNSLQPLKVKGNPGLGNLGVGFQGKYTLSKNYPVLYDGSLERIAIDLIPDGSGGYLIHTAYPIR